MAAAAAVTACHRVGRVAGVGVVGLGGLLGGAAAVGCATSPGFRRSLRFYSSVAPFALEHYAIRAHARWYERCSEEELDGRLAAFHRRTASRCVEVILSLGGIYVKVGQFASTMGAGVLEDAYIEALRPLQDGVPPRPLAEVAAIIEQSTGERLDTLFESFSPVPVGAASIAQAHVATLKGGQRCIVKVQYPEVAELYEADFDNLEAVVGWLMPENAALIRGLRRRHAELDFRNEARNLEEIGANMRARSLEPVSQAAALMMRRARHVPATAPQ
jgi:aarF domain-containing kinase